MRQWLRQGLWAMLVGLASLNGCSGSSGSSSPPHSSTPSQPVGITISGTVMAPGGVLAKNDSGFKRWFAWLLPDEAYAQFTSLKRLSTGKVFVFEINDDGSFAGPVLATAMLDGNRRGTFSVTLPVGTTLGTRLIIQAAQLNDTDPTPLCDPGSPGCTATGNTLSIPAISTNVTISPSSEAMLRMALDKVAAGKIANLGNLTVDELQQLESLIDTLVSANSSLVNGTTATVVQNIITNLGSIISAALDILGAPGSTIAPVILTTSLPDAVTGQNYSVALVAVGGVGQLTWALQPNAPNLPSGMSLNQNGLLNGHPTGSGMASVQVQVTAAATPDSPVTKTLSLTVSLPGTGGTFPVTVSEGVNPQYSWPDLPAAIVAVTRASDLLTSVWQISATLPGISSPVTHGTVPNGASAGVTTETTLTDGVAYQVTVQRTDGQLGITTFTAKALPPPPPPPPFSTGPGYDLAFMGHGTVGSNSFTIGPAVREPVTTTFNDLKQMVGFDSFGPGITPGETPTIGSMSVSELFIEGPISLGRWNDGISGGNYLGQQNITITLNQGLHYVVANPATPSSSMPSSGTANYTLLASTKPTYLDGTPAVSSANAVTGLVVVSYSTKQIAMDLTVVMPDKSYSVKTLAGTQNPTFSEIQYVNQQTGAQVFGGSIGLASSARTMGGFFAGPNADYLGFIIQGAAGRTEEFAVAVIFKKVTTP